jgi:hypothetical protein
MGKVGSAAIRDSLNAIGIINYQVHYLDHKKLENLTNRHEKLGMKIPPHILRSKEVLSGNVLNNRGVKIISLMRDPVARNVSAFFQNLETYFPQTPLSELDSALLIDTFITKYSHRISVDWFKNEFLPVTKIDVCANSVNKTNGCYTFNHENIDVLLIKVEANDEEKVKALKEFLDLPDTFTLLKINIGDEKSYSEKYKEFKSKIKLPKSYLDEMYDSKLICHFYDDDSIAKMRSKWEG